jgi:recombination protein RecR
MRYPAYLNRLVDALKALPGVGTRTAERFAFQMLTWDEGRLEELAKTIGGLNAAIAHCPTCGCLMEERCTYCGPQRRDSKILCLVGSPKDVFAIEDTGEYRGLYHVLDGLLSPLEGRGPEVLRLDRLHKRLDGLEEAIIALDSTVDGDATALYLKNELERHNVRVSRLAFGLPMGSPLDYVDGGTLARAFSGRNTF